MVAIPLIPFLAEAAAAAAAATASYIALNTPAVKNAIASTGKTLGDAIGEGMNAASQAIDDGIEKAKKAIAGVSKEVSTTQSCSTNTCGGGDGDDDGNDKKKTPEEKAQEELGKLKGKSKAEIEQKLKDQGYKRVPSKNGGDVWTKDLGNGKTQAVRIDPGKVRVPSKGWADEVPHVHKELVPTSRITNGNYKPADAIKLNDQGIKTTDPGQIHIPIKP